MLALGCAASAVANPRAAMLIGAADVESIGNFQEYAAAKQFIANGGSLLLTKQATQLVHRLGRIDAKFAPNIYGDGDGGNGTDVWTINAHIGYDSAESDPTQYYDHSDHPIYDGVTTLPAHHEFANFKTETFPMEGTGDGTEMWREDHNCMWDLNAYTYTADGKNTVERFENDNNASVIGTWGQATDYAVAGIVEFKPTADIKGTIIANGLAACEWSPRSGVNAYHANLEKLTNNSINYLITKISGIDGIYNDADTDAPAEYYNLQGVHVPSDNLSPGIYIIRQGNIARKIAVK